MHHEQDMRKMGGLWKKIPYTYAGMIIGTLAITGFGIPTVIGLAGYYSKDLIMESAFAAHTPVGSYAFVLGALAAVMTAFYSWRLIFMTFHGETRAKKSVFDHAHESPLVMLIPLAVLSVGALASGYLFEPMFSGHHQDEFWAGSIFTLPENHILHHAHDVDLWVKLTPFVAGIIGLLVAYIFYIKRTTLPTKLAASQHVLYDFLLNKWYFDELYNAIFVKPALFIGRIFWERGDGKIFDGIINGVSGKLIPMLSRTAGRLQSGYIFHYAAAMIAGLAVFITWYSIFGIAH
jgi:NADH-quinone oxidoreductase subunit L